MTTTKKDLRELHVKFNREAAVTTSKFIERGVLDSFRCQKSKCTETGDDVTFVLDDVALLLEFEKKKKFSPDVIASIVESMSAVGKSSELDSLRSKLSDDELIAFVKSRHIQSASELSAWCNYLNRMTEQELSAFSDEIKSRIPEPPEPEKIQKVEVVNASGTPKSE